MDRRIGPDAGVFLTRVAERDTGGVSLVGSVAGVSHSALEGISGSGEVEGVKHIDRRSLNRVTSISDPEDEDAEALEDFAKAGSRALSAQVWN